MCRHAVIGDSSYTGGALACGSRAEGGGWAGGRSTAQGHILGRVTTDTIHSDLAVLKPEQLQIG
jgi:hypothetical protein